MKAAQLLVKSLEAAGITHIFGVPGEENLAVLEALRESNIRFVTTRDEQAAAFMATTFGRMTGRVGVALATLGPGATNFTTAVAYAQLGAMPLLVITGQKPIRKRRQAEFQIVDVVAMMRPITKMTTTVLGGDSIPSVVMNAVRMAESERPGAVHIELAEDVAEDETTAKPLAYTPVRYGAANQDDIAAVAEAIDAAQMPMLVVAHGANRHPLGGALDAFIAKTNMPFITSQLGKGAADETSEYCIGTGAFSANDYAHRALARADVVIVVGYDVFEKPPFFPGKEQKIISINFFPTEYGEVTRTDMELIGDIAGSLRALTERVSERESRLHELAHIRQANQADVADKSNWDDFPVKPQRLARELRQIMPADGIISLDNGMHKLWFARNYPAQQPNTVLLDNALATMGAGLPVAMACKMLDPSKTVVAVVGDGGFMMNVADLETAVRLGLSLVVVILNDSGYGMIKWKQAGMGLSDFGLDFGNPDFVQLAQSFGATGHRITEAYQFAETVQGAIDAGGVHIIDVPVDYTENSTLQADALKARTQDL